jgi:hypothetical protein
VKDAVLREMVNKFMYNVDGQKLEVVEWSMPDYWWLAMPSGSILSSATARFIF